MIVQACLKTAAGRWHLPLPSAGGTRSRRGGGGPGRAHEIHLHVRGAGGRESLAPADVDTTNAALRAAVPGTLIGISTGAWIEGDDDRRLAYMADWRELPDYASVNLSEPGAPAVIERLRRLGVGIEAGLAQLRTPSAWFAWASSRSAFAC